MLHQALLPAIRHVLQSIRQKKAVDEIVGGVLQTACSLAKASHGSFVLVDHETRRLRIAQVFGADWTSDKQQCQLSFGEGLTGHVAATGEALLCQDTQLDPRYYPLFDYVRSELIVPVVVEDKVWGVINIDGPEPHAFDEITLQLLQLFAELTAFAITLRMELDEQDRLHSMLLQSEKLASLGEALAGIAHEINNPLTAILGFAELLEPELPRAPQVDAVRVIKAESQRAAGLIRDVLAFSRKETGQRQQVDVAEIVDHAVALQKFQLQVRNVDVLVDRRAQALPVLVCPQQITQVLLNLIKNAVQAFAPGQKDPTITLSCARDGALARITVADNGPGIPPNLQRCIFDPFFTTKAPGEGTGLGLAIAHSILEAHGGRIRLANSSADGTEFVLELPIAEQPAPEAPVPDSAASPVASLAGRVLVVDDEPHILEPVVAHLKSLQLEVQQAQSAPAALDVLGAHVFDAVITDIRMPGMDGLEFYDTARRLHPRYEKRFVFMSGLLRENIRTFFAESEMACLEKPFSLYELHQVLLPILDGKVPAPAGMQYN